MAQQNTQRKTRKSKKKSIQPGCLFWIALILLAITIYIVKHEDMKRIAEKTGFLSFFEKPEEIKDKEVPEKIEPELKIRRIAPEKPKTVAPEQNSVIIEETSSPEAVSTPEKRETTAQVTLTEQEVPAVAKATSNTIQKPKPAPFKVRDSYLYFIVINEEDGSTHLRKASRSIRYTDSPLTATMHSLLSGVSSSDINNNYMSLLPEGTKLNKLWIKDGTAYMDFNENFLFNSFGREGYMVQLKQIVYTATEFSTVKKVQILIDGKYINYLGEGIYIGKPIARQSFGSSLS